MKGKSPISKYLIVSIIILSVGIPTFPVFAQTSPVISSAVWDDADNGDEVLSAGDTLTITFDSATNRPGGTGTLEKGIVDNLFTFANSIGTDYTGVWSSATTFVITIVDATGATASIGDTVSAKGTLQFTGTLDTTGGTAINDPVGIATNSTDHIFVGNTFPPSVVQIFNPDGTFAGTVDTTGGTAFNTPHDIATNSTDFIFVADSNAANVQIFNPDGTFAGTVDTTGGTAFANAHSIATNSTDFIFVADFAANVQIFNPDGTFAGTVDTTGGTAFVNAQSIAINSTDFIFVGDFTTDLVQIFNPDGTFAGTVDTTGGTAFNTPHDIATNSTDFIFVADSDLPVRRNVANVQIFNPDGTFAGTVDTTGGSAFINPENIATNSRDDLFVTDFTADNVQRFSQGIRNSPSTSLPATGGTTTTGDFGEPCLPPSSGNWVVEFDCTLVNDAIAPASVIIQSGSVLTIPAGLSLDIDFSQFNLTVESGGGVLIKAGGKIT